jgi:type IV pilus assembly protein PilV
MMISCSITNTDLLPDRSRLARQRRVNRGFSLLEVLITIVVVAIGLLGVAGLQVTSVKLADISATRSLGVTLTSEISARIRANRANASAYVTDWGQTPTATATLAEGDLALWKGPKGLGALPSGDGKIVLRADPSCDTVATYQDCSIVTVSVSWDERRARGGEENPKKKLFETSFRI